MGLNKRCLKGLIEHSDLRNTDGLYGESDVMGVGTDKSMFPTKADLNGVNLRNYKLFPPGSFAYVADTSRRGNKIALTYNDTDKIFIVSTWYVVFKICDSAKDIITSEYLFLYFNRAEFDRYARANSWGSAREYFWFEDMEDIEIQLPDLPTQQKYVDIYNAMVANQQAYERGLEDLKLTCDGYIEDLRRKMPCEKIGPYLRPCNERNSNNAISLFQGVNVEHIFTDPKRVAEDCENGSIVRTGQFAFNRVMKSHNTKLPIALRDGPDCVVSSSYQVFEIVNVEVLMPQYLMLWMNRKETQRFAGYVSYGTTRDIFSFENMCDVQIPIPSIKVQKSIAEMYTVYNARKKINEQLKAQIKNICPILIRGSLEEGK